MKAKIAWTEWCKSQSRLKASKLQKPEWCESQNGVKARKASYQNVFKAKRIAWNLEPFQSLKRFTSRMTSKPDFLQVHDANQSQNWCLSCCEITQNACNHSDLKSDWPDLMWFTLERTIWPWNSSDSLLKPFLPWNHPYFAVMRAVISFLLWTSVKTRKVWKPECFRGQNAFKGWIPWRQNGFSPKSSQGRVQTFQSPNQSNCLVRVITKVTDCLQRLNDLLPEADSRHGKVWIVWTASVSFLRSKSVLSLTVWQV